MCDARTARTPDDKSKIIETRRRLATRIAKHNSAPGAAACNIDFDDIELHPSASLSYNKALAHASEITNPASGSRRSSKKKPGSNRTIAIVLSSDSDYRTDDNYSMSIIKPDLQSI